MYSTWLISELKAELKKRGASLRGKKADLIERLVLYDKHFSMDRSECVEEEDSMALPPNESYKDINSDTILPALNNTQIRLYLSCTTKKFEAAMELYESRHLLAVRSSAIGDETYVKGFCRKTMKKLHYEVDIKFDKLGNPAESHCECPTGSGQNAVCKHHSIMHSTYFESRTRIPVLCFPPRTNWASKYGTDRECSTPECTVLELAKVYLLQAGRRVPRYSWLG